MKVLLVDPSLFTAPYNAALTSGLEGHGTRVLWARRDLRPGEDSDLPPRPGDLTFYPLTDGPRRKAGRLWKLVKGLEHWAGLRRVARAARQVDVVHFQWTPLPSLDAPAMRRIARRGPVVLTVHDTEPFNGAGVSALQRAGFDAVFRAADHLIVHSDGAKATLAGRGVPPERISVIAHGPLHLRCQPQPVADKAPGRWRVVLFGRLQSYKGVDLLIEAAGLLEPSLRDRLEIIVAGEALMDLAPLLARAAALGLSAPGFQIRAGRLSDQARADLLGSADTFVFPYRAIEASGVLFLVAALRKWIIASDLGAFSDLLAAAPDHGRLVPVGDAAALARALAECIAKEPAALGSSWAPDWDEIGAQTRAVYASLITQQSSHVASY